MQPNKPTVALWIGTRTLRLSAAEHQRLRSEVMKLVARARKWQQRQLLDKLRVALTTPVSKPEESMKPTESKPEQAVKKEVP